MSSGTVVTSNVRRKLIKEAARSVHTPYVPSDTAATNISKFALVGMILATVIVTLPLLSTETLPVPITIAATVIVWISVIAYSILVHTRLWNLQDQITEEYRKVVSQLADELAVARENKIQDRGQFYSSAEWKRLRATTIMARGSRCERCGIVPENTGDLTVDHVLPRSKHPELALGA